MIRNDWRRILPYDLDHTIMTLRTDRVNRHTGIARVIGHDRNLRRARVER